MIIYMGAFRALAEFFKEFFKEKEKEPIAEGGDGELNLMNEQEKKDKEIMKDGGWKCYSCGYVNRKLTINCEKCAMGKYESDDRYKEDAICRLEEARKKKKEL